MSLGLRELSGHKRIVAAASQIGSDKEILMAEQNPAEKIGGALNNVLTTGLDSAEKGIDTLIELAKLAKVAGVGTARGTVNVASDTLDSLITNLEAIKADVREQAQGVADTLTGQDK